MSKSCVICDIKKTKDSFRKLQLICIDCESNPDTVYHYIKCNKCGEEKKNSMFRKKRKTCIDCERSSGRNYRRRTTKAKEWVEKNRERMSQLQRNHYEKNKSKIREKERTRMKEEPKFRYIKNYRIGLNRMIRGGVKSNKKLNITHELFLEWLDFCSDKSISFDNYAEVWNIDHIVPIDFIISEKGKNNSLILEWYNVRACEPKENLKKNKYIDIDCLISHLHNLELFLKQHKDMEEKHTTNLHKYRKLVQKLIDDRYTNKACLQNALMRETPKAQTTTSHLETNEKEHD